MMNEYGLKSMKSVKAGKYVKGLSE